MPKWNIFVTSSQVFVLITEIFWPTFGRNNWRSIIDVVERLCSCQLIIAAHNCHTCIVCIKIDLKHPTYDVIDVLIWQQVGWTPQKISVISVIFRPFVTKALVSSPKSMIITGIVQPPHMAAIMPRASKILSWALENRNWNKKKIVKLKQVSFQNIKQIWKLFHFQS